MKNKCYKNTLDFYYVKTTISTKEDPNAWCANLILNEDGSPRGNVWIHKDAAILCSPDDLGAGSIICENAVIGANVKCDGFSIIRSDAWLGCDIKIGEFALIMSSVKINSGVVFGKHVYVGYSTEIDAGIILPDNAFITQGQHITKNTEKIAIIHKGRNIWVSLKKPEKDLFVDVKFCNCDNPNLITGVADFKQYFYCKACLKERKAND